MPVISFSQSHPSLSRHGWFFLLALGLFPLLSPPALQAADPPVPVAAPAALTGAAADLKTAIVNHAANPTAANLTALQLAQSAYTAAVTTARDANSGAWFENTTNTTKGPTNSKYLSLSGNHAAFITTTDSASLTFQGYAGVVMDLSSGDILDLHGGGSASTGYSLSFTNGTTGYLGGAILNNYGTLSLSNASFSSNAANFGGAIYNDHGTLSLSNASFSSNEAYYGGAILNSSGTVSLSNVSFANNTANQYGGAIFTGSGAVTLSNVSFTNNISGEGGGAIFSSNSSTPLSLTTTAGHTSLFTGNTVVGVANSIHLHNTSFNSHTETGALLDMRDPMSRQKDTSTIAITHTGAGVWALGGSNVFERADEGQTAFAVNEGTLYLYAADEVVNPTTDAPDAMVAAGSLQLDSAASSFTLGSTATLVAGGSNSVTTAGRIDLAAGSTIRGGNAGAEFFDDGVNTPRTELGGDTALTLTATSGVNLLGKVNIAAPEAGKTFTLNAALRGGGSLDVTGPGTVSLTQASTFGGGVTVSSGTLLANNTTGSATGTGTVTVTNGGTFGGSGNITGPVFINSGGAISPGNSIGSQSTGSQTWAGGGTYLWELNATTGGLGVNWDYLNITGDLNITATAGNKFNIEILSFLQGTTTPGEIDNFNSQSLFSWDILSVSGEITGYDADAFFIDDSTFKAYNDLAGGSFGIYQRTEDILSLRFTPYNVPEPGSGVLCILALSSFVLRRNREIPPGSCNRASFGDTKAWRSNK